jgi:hypothetical protein
VTVVAGEPVRAQLLLCVLSIVASRRLVAEKYADPLERLYRESVEPAA